jgi:transposase
METFRLAEKDPAMGKNAPAPTRRTSGTKSSELARAGRRLDDLASEFELGRQTVRNWVKQADLDAGRRSDRLTSAESTEVARLRKRVRQLETERDILLKAAAWFARETDSIPPKSSNS